MTTHWIARESTSRKGVWEVVLVDRNTGATIPLSDGVGGLHKEAAESLVRRLNARRGKEVTP